MASEDSASFQPLHLLRIDNPGITEIPEYDNGEPLVNLLDLHRLILPSQLTDASTYLEDSPTPFARQRIKTMLEAAIAGIPDDYVIVLIEAQRTYEHQKKVYQDVRESLRTDHQDLSEPELDTLTQAFASNPDIYSPHVTGAAVDVAIARREGGSYTLIDMGSSFEYSEKDATGYPYLTDVQKANRKLLKDVWTQAGFVNYEREWWHWSWGDKLWAYLTGQSHAVYGPVYSPA